MLVLSRKKDDEILIEDEGGNVIARITVVKIEGYKVRLGVDADQKVKILRGELRKPNSAHET